ncbi:hypothetical protein ACFVS2_21010 [Brevibacillus sp. NPDC058079]|uniref:hypothetical protein n=1 Tax=Brevibacillus sp. NPDC058079 TaxID=3346330 RepID=UPI0036E81EFE
MAILERHWWSGHWKDAIVTIPGIIRENEFYHIVDYETVGEISKCLIINADGQEHWVDVNCFGDKSKKGLFYSHIKKVAVYAATIIEQNNDDNGEAFVLLHRMYLMSRLLRTNSMVLGYNRETITFLFDNQLEPDRQQKDRVMNWRDFETFVFERTSV